ncbi:hypothetical protein GpartN1_g3452.t1 [Galdieria partita]|uniref:Transmembrane 9 superfamily member n=1 Tax=Galdieria partita TaxID=83374 RepID=A0A9C7PW82_9RHOD|nr:hypothetical protein GpartN1_g3452.t1 [Galdieria partita]
MWTSYNPQNLRNRRLFQLTLLLYFVASSAFYIPGIYPNDYPQGAELDIRANKLTSSRSNVPYDFYFLPFCPPPEEKEKKLNMGQILLGEHSKSTPFKAFMLVPETCKVACQRTLDSKDVAKLKTLIRRDYRARLNLDNMPLVVKKQTQIEEGDEYYQLGYPVGYSLNDQFYIYNHLHFKILYHRPNNADAENLYRVVGFEVQPSSLAHSGDPEDPSFCSAAGLEEVSVGKNIYFTYNIEFEESPVRWATRWDPLLKATEEQEEIQWFSIINSLLTTLFLTALVGMIMLRTIRKDLMRYSQPEDEEEIQEETGWKLIHGDVFRSPPYLSLFCVAIGTGAHVISIACITLLFALVGFLSPANRGGLLSAMVSLWILTSMIAGYVSSRLYKSLGGLFWKRVALGTAILFPGLIFVVFFCLNFLMWLSQSNDTVPFSTLVLILFLWFGISLPLVFLGSYFGRKRPSYDFPVRVNQIPRKIPRQPWYNNTLLSVLIGGILPFGSVFIQLVFILGSLWQNEVYYMFGFLSIVFVLLIITSAEISIVLCYLRLCGEDYRWWFYSFFSAGSSGLYVFLYSLFYLTTQPDFNGIDFVSLIVYLSYMSVISMAFTFLTGFVGFMSCFWFTRKIYSAIRVD